MKAKIIKVYKKCDDALAIADQVFIAIFVFVIAACILISIVLRALSLQSFPWLDELSRIMLVTTTLCGSSLAIRSNDHMVMDSLYGKLSERTGDILRAFVNWLCGGFFLFLFYHALLWTRKLFLIHKMMSSIKMPLWPVWALVSFFILTMGIRHIASGFSWLERSRHASRTRPAKKGGNREEVDPTC